MWCWYMVKVNKVVNMNEAIKAKRKELKKSIGKPVSAMGELGFTIATAATMYVVWFEILPSLNKF